MGWGAGRGGGDWGGEESAEFGQQGRGGSPWHA